MIRVAMIGGAQRPLFEFDAPDQPSMAERFAWVFKHDAQFREAVRSEGMDPDELPAIPARKGGEPDRERKRGRARGRGPKSRL